MLSPALLLLLGGSLLLLTFSLLRPGAVLLLRLALPFSLRTLLLFGASSILLLGLLPFGLLSPRTVLLLGLTLPVGLRPLLLLGASTVLLLRLLLPLSLVRTRSILLLGLIAFALLLNLRAALTLLLLRAFLTLLSGIALALLSLSALPFSLVRTCAILLFSLIALLLLLDLRTVASAFALLLLSTFLTLLSGIAFALVGLTLLRGRAVLLLLGLLIAIHATVAVRLLLLDIRLLRLLLPVVALEPGVATLANRHSRFGCRQRLHAFARGRSDVAAMAFALACRNPATTVHRLDRGAHDIARLDPLDPPAGGLLDAGDVDTAVDDAIVDGHVVRDVRRVVDDVHNLRTRIGVAVIVAVRETVERDEGPGGEKPGRDAWAIPIGIAEVAAVPVPVVAVDVITG